MIHGKTFLSLAEFMALPKEKREVLRRAFAIPKSGQTRVESSPMGDRLVSDGTEAHDLLVTLNISATLKFLGKEFNEKKEYDFDALFAEVTNILFREEQPVPTQEAEKEPIPVSIPKEESEYPKSIKKTAKIVVTQRKKKNG